ncbi:MAG: hypothetical protein AAF531_10450 [Actinomycetota bacterium]
MRAFWKQWLRHHYADHVHTTAAGHGVLLGADWSATQLLDHKWLDPNHPDAAEFEWAIVFNLAGQIPGHPIVCTDQIGQTLYGFDPGGDFSVDDLDIDRPDDGVLRGGGR